MTVLDLIRPKSRLSPARAHPVRLSPEAERCRGEVHSLVTEFRRGRSLQKITNLACVQDFQLSDSDAHATVTFALGGHGWVYYDPDGHFGFALNTGNHWCYAGLYTPCGPAHTTAASVWTAKIGSWPSLPDGIAKASWASPLHVVLAAKAAVAAWQS